MLHLLRPSHRPTRQLAAVGLLAASRVLADSGQPHDFSLQNLAGHTSPPVIYVARELITMNSDRPRAEAVAVQNGTFLAEGTRAEVQAADPIPSGQNGS